VEEKRDGGRGGHPREKRREATNPPRRQAIPRLRLLGFFSATAGSGGRWRGGGGGGGGGGLLYLPLRFY
jgi:hypothetical protein